MGEIGKKIKNIKVLGLYKDVDRFLSQMEVDIFFIALFINEYHCFEGLVKKTHGNLSEIKVVPASYEFLGLRGGMDALGDLPIMSLQESPLYGWDSVFKRMFDLILGTIILLATSPLMLIISLLDSSSWLRHLAFKASFFWESIHRGKQREARTRVEVIGKKEVSAAGFCLRAKKV